MGFELNPVGGIVTPDKTAVGEVAGHAGLATVDRQREDERHIADAASVGQRAVAWTGPGVAGVHHLPGEIEVVVIPGGIKRVAVEDTVLMGAAEGGGHVVGTAGGDNHIV